MNRNRKTRISIFSLYSLFFITIFLIPNSISITVNPSINIDEFYHTREDNLRIRECTDSYYLKMDARFCTWRNYHFQLNIKYESDDIRFKTLLFLTIKYDKNGDIRKIWLCYWLKYTTKLGDKEKIWKWFYGDFDQFSQFLYDNPIIHQLLKGYPDYHMIIIYNYLGA